jgi:hypothetical protein
MSRKLRQLKRQMFLKQVESSKDPSPVDSFRSLIINLAVEEEAKEAYRSRSNSLSSDNSCTSFNDSLRSIGDLRWIEE